MERTSISNNLKPKCFVGAIDIGTTYSGYAFLIKNEFQTTLKADNSKIHCPTWENEGRLSHKVPTSVLFRPTKTLHSFGYDAERYYTDNPDDIDFKEWYFFKHFRTKLSIDQDVLTKDTLIEDSNESGRRMKAVDVFAAVINYFKDHLLHVLRNSNYRNNSFEYLNNNDIHWVITVPVIWDLKGKQFMKDAAEKAGIFGNQLTLVFEPEAVLSYFHASVDTPKFGGMTIPAMKIGSQYIVVNNGGATTDITAYEVIGPRMPTEIHQSHCDGDTITDKFVKFLTTLLGEPVIKEIRDKHPSAYFALVSNFDHRKTSFSVQEESMVIIRIPCDWIIVCENKTGKTLKETIRNSPFNGAVRIINDKLKMRNDFFRTFFDSSINKFLDAFEELFRKPAITNITTVLLMGGYLESSVLINAFKQKFPNPTVIVPKESDLAVLKGAVLYGLEPYTLEIQEKDMASGSGKFSERRAMDSEDVEILMAAVDISEEKTDSQYKQLIPIVENFSQECTNIEDIPRETNVYTEAQAAITYVLPASVLLQLQLYVKMSINGKIYDCVKIRSTLVLTDYKNSQLIIYNLDDFDINHIPLPDKPNNLTEINSNTVAVSCRNDETILIINIPTGNITSKLKTIGNCYGISSDHNNLYVVIVHSMIQMMDLTGTEIRSIPLPAGDIEDITVDRNRIVCIDCNTIYCCSLDGTVIWKYRKSESYQDLRRVTTDGRGTVYVTNGMTDNVVVVSNDGKHYRELITSENGLNRPSGIHFDKEENVLFVCNDGDGKAFLFQVEEKR